MIKINANTKKLWAEKTFELTNIGAGATLFGQFIYDKGFSWTATIIGILLVIVGYIASYFLTKK